jgi:hypothetical protein
MDSELYKPFKLNFWLFKTVGMWQDGNQSWLYFIFGYIFHFFVIECYVICQFVYAINADNLADTVDALGYCITNITVALQSVNFFIRVRRFEKILESLNSLLEFSATSWHKERVHIKQEVAFAFKVYKVFWGTAVTTCIIGGFVPFTAHELPYKGWFPFDTSYGGIGFWIASVYMVLNTTFPIAAICISLDILPVILMSFAIGLIRELEARLSEIGATKTMKVVRAGTSREIFVKPSSETCQNRLVKCLEIHKKIIKLVDEIHDNFSTAILIQGLMSSVIICMCAFTMSVVSIN